MKSTARILKKQLFTHFLKGLFSLTILSLSFPVLALDDAGEEFYASGYNSREAGLEDNGFSRRGRVYSMDHLEGLRRSLSPRYIRFLDWLETSRETYLRRGILFTLESFDAQRVSIAGDFNNWRPRLMHRNKMGVFYFVQPLTELERGKIVTDYRYKFLVDGIWVSDPRNKSKTSDGLGGYISYFHLDEMDVNRQITAHLVPEAVAGEEKLVEFAIYLPDVENLSIVGNFNNWNPEHDFLRKGEDGIFRIRKHLSSGEYIYKYVADGKWVLDTFNPDTRYYKGIDELCSYYKVD